MLRVGRAAAFRENNHKHQSSLKLLSNNAPLRDNMHLLCGNMLCMCIDFNVYWNRLVLGIGHTIHKSTFLIIKHCYSLDILYTTRRQIGHTIHKSTEKEPGAILEQFSEVYIVECDLNVAT